MKNDYEKIKTKAAEILYANKHTLIAKIHYPSSWTYKDSQIFKPIIQKGKYKDLSKLKYDEDCGE